MAPLALFPAVAGNSPRLGHRWSQGPGDASECTACGVIWYPWAARPEVVRHMQGRCPEWMAALISPHPLPGSLAA